jgi:predicted DNA-binding protein with PD1-like motif
VDYRKISSVNNLEGATYALVFADGDEAVAELLRFAREEHVKSAHLSGIGAASKVMFAYLDLGAKRYEPIELDEQVEVVSLSGNFALAEDGRPMMHVHVVVAKRDGSAYGGHLLKLHVRPTLEVFVTTSPARLRRRKLPDLPVATIRLGEG